MTPPASARRPGWEGRQLTRWASHPTLITLSPNHLTPAQR